MRSRSTDPTQTANRWRPAATPRSGSCVPRWRSSSGPVADPPSRAGHRGSADARAVPPDVARFALVRHGETEYNRQGRWQGAGSDPPLNDRGREQARRVATALARVPFDALYSSDLDRALETAHILTASHGLVPRVLGGLREMSHGAW